MRHGWGGTRRVAIGLAGIGSLFVVNFGCSKTGEETSDGTGTGGTGGHAMGSDAAGGSAGPSVGGGLGTGVGGLIQSSVPREHWPFEANDEIVLRNPERGFYRATNIIEEDSLSWIEDEYSLYFSYVRLDAYRDVEIPSDFLEEIEAGFAKVRAEGAKLVLRFAYNFGPYPDSEPDASLEWVLAHIEQLTPLIQENVDVIATLQAGFIGAWGEWHTSTNGLDNITDKKEVLDALLAALPESRTVQLRYPPDLMEMYDETPLSLEGAWSGSAQSRTGHHNDCFLAGDRDTGTYPAPLDPEVYKQFLSSNNLYVPMGGETCAVSPPRSECDTALAEMQGLRFSFINDDYHPDVVASWTTGGCREEMERSLGYRLTLTAVDAPVSVAPGDPVTLVVSLRNDGWAAPMNPRPVFLVLEQGSEVHRLLADDGGEVRAWLPGEVTQVVFRGIVPEGLEEGEASVQLWLPDAADGLALDARYSIRLTNAVNWLAETGSNALGGIEIAGDAPIDDVPGALPFEAGWQDP